MKLYQSRIYLYQKYVVENMTVTEIAKELNCSIQSVQSNLVKFNLIRNSRKWAK